MHQTAPWHGSFALAGDAESVSHTANEGMLLEAGQIMTEPVVAVVHSDPGIMGGTPVFVGMRVPFQTLLDYLEAGDPLSEFLEDFPTVSREQAVAALEAAKDLLLARLHAA